MDGKSDTVLHADLAHEFRHMGFHGSLFNSQNRTDFLVGTASDQQLQHFFFAIRESNAACGKNSTGRGSDPLNENGEHASWRPNRTLIHIPHRLNKLRRRRSFVNIALRAGGERFQNGFIIGSAAGDDNAQVGPRGLESGHHVEQVLSGTGSQQYQVDVLPRTQFHQTASKQFKIGLGVKQPFQSYETQSTPFHDCDLNGWLLRRGDSHQGSSRGTHDWRIVSKILISRPESVINFRPSPLFSTVHVLRGDAQDSCLRRQGYLLASRAVRSEVTTSASACPRKNPRRYPSQ